MSLLLSDSQHSELMRLYLDLRLSAGRDAESNRKIAYNAIPELKEIDKSISDVSIKALRRIDGLSPESLPAEIKRLNDKRKELLTGKGFPEDFLDIKYCCSLCGDTGFIEGVRCDCFKRRVIDLIYSDRRWKSLFKEENFDTFDITYYDDDRADDDSGFTPRAAALDALEKAHEFAESVISPEPGARNNLLISGNTGNGKTFLCNCIAKELIDAGLYVVYLTAPSFFEIIEKASFSQQRNKREFSPDANSFSYSSLFDSDLLIIDDLGTETANTFTVSKLFDIINRRLLDERPMLISTNLNLSALRSVYSERVTSRITGYYKFVHLYGDDIRLKKRLLAGKIS